MADTGSILKDSEGSSHPDFVGDLAKDDPLPLQTVRAQATRGSINHARSVTRGKRRQHLVCQNISPSGRSVPEDSIVKKINGYPIRSAYEWRFSGDV